MKNEIGFLDIMGFILLGFALGLTFALWIFWEDLNEADVMRHLKKEKLRLEIQLLEHELNQ
jgi:hypothetical protein